MNTNKNPGITRREFFRSGVLLGSAVAVSGIYQTGAAAHEIRHPVAHFKVSCAAYSYRKYLKSGEMNLFDFINRCVDMDIDAVELTSYYFPEKITNAYLNELKRKTFLHGLDISGTAIANNFCVPPGEKRDKEIEHVKKWIDYAAGFSAPCIRIFAGNPEKGVSQSQAIQWSADAIKTCLDYAGKRGVFLALENHGGIVARAAVLKTICDKVGFHPWFGVNLDTGNFRTDPYGDMQLIAPYAITVQVKDWVTAPDGKTRQEANLKKVLDILRAANYRGYLALEYEGKEDPKTGVPKWIARLKEEAYK
ncbi:MAG TPA: sugar phosphate isomerase/epimerase [Bacteroidetes bacterium]|nr:sugar phosphate isomerase/epimerase [Bacteroidota bacterium]